MSLFKNIAFTARSLAVRPLLEQIKRVADLEHPDVIVLREKDMTDEEYSHLAQELTALCQAEGMEFFCNGRAHLAREMGCKNIQMSMGDLELESAQLSDFEQVWASVHSVDDAKHAVELGAHAVIFGHVFSTDCKLGLPPRGLGQLREVVEAMQPLGIPVYGIGGVNPRNAGSLMAVGARGACRMSYFMGL